MRILGAHRYSVCNSTHCETAVDSRMALQPIGSWGIRKCTHKKRHTQKDTQAVVHVLEGLVVGEEASLDQLVNEVDLHAVDQRSAILWNQQDRGRDGTGGGRVGDGWRELGKGKSSRL